MNRVCSELQLSLPSLSLSTSLSVCLSPSHGELRRWNKRHVLPCARQEQAVSPAKTDTHHHTHTHT